MNNGRILKLFRPTEPQCNICGSSMGIQSGSRGYFYSCSKYPNCTGSRDAMQVTFTVFTIGNKSILNNSRINCTMDGVIHKQLDVVLKDGCFGVIIENSFILLKDCSDVELYK